MTVSIERIEYLDDRVLVLAAFHGTESNVEVHVEGAWLCMVNDRRIVHLCSFATWKEALEAAGLRE